MDGDEGSDAGAEAHHLVHPELAAGEGIKRIHVAVHADDEAISIQQEAGVDTAEGCLPLPEDFAGVPMQGGDAFVEAGEEEVGEVHEEVGGYRFKVSSG